MRKCVAAMLLLALAPFLRAQQCVPQLQVQPNSRIDINVCADTPAIAVGDNFTIDPGDGVPLAVTATRVVNAGILGTNVETNALDPGSPVLTNINNGQTVKLTINGESVTANVKSALSAQNYTRYNWSVGPATKGQTNAITTTTPAGGTDDPTGAIRLRYDGEYARGGFFGYRKIHCGRPAPRSASTRLTRSRPISSIRTAPPSACTSAISPLAASGCMAKRARMCGMNAPFTIRRKTQTSCLPSPVGFRSSAPSRCFPVRESSLRRR
jgi:hypothetical protein